jgi:cytochrome b involved in lipid metabolism
MANSIFTSSLLDTFGGLPVHPLAVHGAVVLLPLSALALALLIFVPKWRKSFFPLTIIGLGLSTVFTYIAKESGEALGERVGAPQTHEALGTILFPASVGLLALGITFYFLQRKERPKWQLQAAAGLALAGIISVSGLTYFVGHSGAEATWASRIAPYETPTGEATPSTDPTATAAGITLTEVASHNSRTDCWTAIDQTVYDLTGYMQQHPGGAGALSRLCGIDGTTAFKSQHGSQQRPASELASLAIGVYAGDVAPTDPTAAPTTEPSATPTSPSAQPGTYTATEVAKHNSGTDCWSVVNGNVYDLTPYVSSHPGGASVIKAICGKDGTAAFSGQHAGASRPNNTLDGFKLGALSTTATGASGTLPQASVPAGEREEGEEDEDH